MLLDVFVAEARPTATLTTPPAAASALISARMRAVSLASTLIAPKAVTWEARLMKAEVVLVIVLVAVAAPALAASEAGATAIAADAALVFELMLLDSMALRATSPLVV